MFACRQGSTLQPTKHKGDLEAFEKAWITKDSWQSAQGYATKYPSKAVTGCASRWASTTGVGATQNHLVIILTDLGWGALGSADMGGVALHTATPTVLPDPTTKMLLGRQELGALQALVGLFTPSLLPQLLFATRESVPWLSSGTVWLTGCARV